MKLTLVFAAAALALVATSGAITPADAQVSIRAGDSRVGIRIGDPAPRVYHQPGVVVYGEADCRTVTVRKTRPNGTVIVTKQRVCD
jgi:hypothetical protein